MLPRLYKTFPNQRQVSGFLFFFFQLIVNDVISTRSLDFDITLNMNWQQEKEEEEKEKDHQ